MEKSGQLIAGTAIILIGLMLLVASLFDLPIWDLCWPTLLILLGLWILLRPRLAGPATGASLVPIGDIRRDEGWELENEEFWVFVADVDLDLRRADLPVGETRYRVTGFAGDVELLAPAEVGMAVNATAFVVTVKADGDKTDHILAPFHYTSDNYAAAERRVRLDVIWFAGEIRIRHG